MTATITQRSRRAVPLRRHARRASLAIALWVFGVATTVLLIGVWGRAVTGDQATLEASARAALDTSLATERITSWVTDGVADALAVAPDETEIVLAGVVNGSSFRSAVDSLTSELVAAAFAPAGTRPSVDVGAALQPLVPAIVDALTGAGIDVDESAIRAALGSLGVAELDAGEVPVLGGAARQARVALTVVVVVAVSVMLAAGFAGVALAEERVRMARTLLVRIAVSAVTFAVVLRLGAWATDPHGGRSPVAAGGGVILRSNGGILFAIAVLTTVAAASTFALRRRARLPAGGGVSGG